MTNLSDFFLPPEELEAKINSSSPEQPPDIKDKTLLEETILIDKANIINEKDKQSKLEKIAQSAKIVKSRLAQLQENEEIKRLFKAYDVSRTGSINYDDFNKTLIKSSSGLSKTDIHDLAEVLDKRSTGSIPYETIVEELSYLEAIANNKPMSSVVRSPNTSSKELCVNRMIAFEEDKHSASHPTATTPETTTQVIEKSTVTTPQASIQSNRVKETAVTHNNISSTLTILNPGTDSSNEYRSPKKRSTPKDYTSNPVFTHTTDTPDSQAKSTDDWHMKLKQSARFTSRRQSEGTLILTREMQDQWYEIANKRSKRYGCRPTPSPYPTPYGSDRNNSDIVYSPILDASKSSRGDDVAGILSDAPLGSSGDFKKCGLRVGYSLGASERVLKLLDNTPETLLASKMLSQTNHDRDLQHNRRRSFRADSLEPPYFAEQTGEQANWNKQHIKKRSQSAPPRRMLSSSTAAPAIERDNTQSLYNLLFTSDTSKNQHQATPEEILTQATLKNKRILSSENAILSYVKDRSNLTHFRHLLNTQDLSRSGKVNYYEFQKVLARSGLDMNRNSIKELFIQSSEEDGHFNASLGQSLPIYNTTAYTHTILYHYDMLYYCTTLHYCTILLLYILYRCIYSYYTL